MKPIRKLEPKKAVRYCGALLLFTLTLCFQSGVALAQSPWEEQPWQRASGNESQFQNSFPDQNGSAVRPAASQQPVGQPAHPSQVQHADHEQLLLEPGRDLNTLESQGPTWQGEELKGFESESGPLKWTKAIQEKFGSIDIKKVVSSLAIVIGGYFGFVWLTRKFGAQSDKGLPSEVFEVIGSAPLNPRQNLQLVRLGSKLLVLVSGDEGASPIAEVSDPDEVEYLTGLCDQKMPGRTTSGSGNNVTVFRRALDRARNEGGSTEAAMDKVINKLSELAGKTNRTNFEA